jgi:hypothetical protein
MNSEQPKPIENTQSYIWDLVISDMKQRDWIGNKKYNTRLQPFNGRDALVDAYQEALDLCVYLRQAIEERDINKCSCTNDPDGTCDNCFRKGAE